MNYVILLSGILAMSSPAFAASKTVMKCAVGDVHDYKGARVNIIENENGVIRANLIFGTTVSGTMYNVEEIEGGFEGAIKSKPQLKIQLTISDEPATNKYITGYKAKLEATYPDVRKRDGTGSVSTTHADEFVCGEQTAPFGR